MLYPSDNYIKSNTAASSSSSYLQQMLLLTFPLSHILVECHDDSLGLCATPQAHTQLGQLVAHGAVERREVLRNGTLPAHFLSGHC